MNFIPFEALNESSLRAGLFQLVIVLCMIVCQTAAAADDKQENPFDHVAAIKGLTADDIAAGKKLYELNCVACHGKDGNVTLNPLARRFGKDKLKFGTGPYAMWKTTSYGNGLMFRWDAVLTAEQRYQIVHYIREAFIKPNNPSQYFNPDDEYFANLPDRAEADAREQAASAQQTVVGEGMIDGKMGKRMIYGPAMSHSLSFTTPKDPNADRFSDTTERAMIIDLPGDTVVSYDIKRMSISGVWKGKIANTGETHHTSYKGLRGMMPGGEVVYKNVDDHGWAVGNVNEPAIAEKSLVFRGHYLHGNDVVLAYEVAGRSVLEMVGGRAADVSLYRTFRVDGGNSRLFCLLSRNSDDRKRAASVLPRSQIEGIRLHSDGDHGLWLEIPPGNDPITFRIGFPLNGNWDTATLSPVPDITPLTKGGPRRWNKIVQTKVVPGKSVEGYAADIFTVPLANPWGSWMRTTAIDFFNDGRIAVSTLSGDVWIVSRDDDTLNWSRFATGLYEPLGLRIVDDKVLVRGRDRITRLHDLNNDGEADFYESFYEEPGEIGPGYHAFIFELQTDKNGYFYYSKSGRKAPHKASIVRLSPDGKRAEKIAGDMRHPNGMGAGGPHDWITISDNPTAKAIYNGIGLVREGATYGYERDRNTPMLAVLPARVDSSSAGQCWSDPERWGPLSGSMIHMSYSLSHMFYVMTQNLDPFPNGFVVQMPLRFNTGLMRARAHPIDGQVYLVGQRGWDASAKIDGVIYRIRHTGEPAHLIKNVEARPTGLRLTFSCDLEPASVHFRNLTAVREADKKDAKPEPVRIGRITVVDARTVDVEIPGIEKETLAHRTATDKKSGRLVVRVRPAIGLTVKFKARDGTPINQTVFATINSLPEK